MTPPNGAAGLDTMPWLMPTIPVSSPSATRMARVRFWVNAYATRPNSVSLAMASPCSSSAKVLTGATGPKISSRKIRALVGTSASTVGV